MWDEGDFSPEDLPLESKTSIRGIVDEHMSLANYFFTHILNLRDAGIDELLADLALMQEHNSRHFHQCEWKKRLQKLPTPLSRLMTFLCGLNRISWSTLRNRG